MLCVCVCVCVCVCACPGTIHTSTSLSACPACPHFLRTLPPVCMQTHTHTQNNAALNRKAAFIRPSQLNNSLPAQLGCCTDTCQCLWWWEHTVCCVCLEAGWCVRGELMWLLGSAVLACVARPDKSGSASSCAPGAMSPKCLQRHNLIGLGGSCVKLSQLIPLPHNFWLFCCRVSWGPGLHDSRNSCPSHTGSHYTEHAAPQAATTRGVFLGKYSQPCSFQILSAMGGGM